MLAFADEHGLPIAIKAAFGGGGRGLKVARERDKVAELFASAVREAEAAFGRGECFVERYLDRPRHVETQVLADAHGGAVVVSTRDCSLQRRHQKLVEEAPAPFLTPEQDAELRRASLAIVREAGYVGAGTVEFLVAADGTLAFLEVNTRLQVEHPVTEEVSGLDLVVEQFRIARGEHLGYTEVATRGHSIEFRINGEDPARELPAPPGEADPVLDPVRAGGPGRHRHRPARRGRQRRGGDLPGLRLAAGQAHRDRRDPRAGPGPCRARAGRVRRRGRAHRHPLPPRGRRRPGLRRDDGRGDFTVHTRWIETDFDASQLPGAGALEAGGEGGQHRETIVVEVAGKRLEVSFPVEQFNAQLSRAGQEISRAGVATGAAVARAYRSATHRGGRGKGKAAGGSAQNPNALVAPMQGTIVKIEVAEGDVVAEGQLVAVLEAMKMEQPLLAHKAGTVTGLSAAQGDTTTTGTVLCEIVDA